MRPDAAAMEVRTPDVLTFRNTLCTKLYYIPTVYTLFLQYYIEISYYCLPDGFRLSGFTTVHYVPTVYTRLPTPDIETVRALYALPGRPSGGADDGAVLARPQAGQWRRSRSGAWSWVPVRGQR